MKIIDNGHAHSSIEKYINKTASVTATIQKTYIQNNFVGYGMPKKLYEVFLYAFAVAGTMDTAATRFVISRGQGAVIKEYYTLAQLANRQIKIVMTDCDYLELEYKTTTGTGTISYEAIFKEMK